MLTSPALDLEALLAPMPPDEPRTAADAFRARYGDALQAYAVSLSAPAPDIVIAVPRKAPRLLELIHEAPELPDVPLAVAISDRALAFTTRDTLDGARVVLTDDTVIYGSTFAGALENLRWAGARVLPRVLGVSRSANAAVASELLDPPLRLTEAQVHGLIDLEIQAFGSLAVPYDIDHPIVTVRLPEREGDAVGRFLRDEPSAWESTRGWQREHGVRVFTLPLPASVLTTHSQRTRQLGPAKLRLFFDPRQHSARLVGIYCLALRSDALEDVGLFAAAPTPLRDAWQLILDGARAADWPLEVRHRALAGAAHYLAGLEAIARWIPTGPKPLREQPGTLRHVDLRWVFGHQLADHLELTLKEILAGEHEFFPAPPDGSAPVVFDAAAEAQAILATAAGPAFSEALTAYLAMSYPGDVGDRTNALFNAQRRIYDEGTRNRDAADVSRLSRSLVPFTAVPALLGVHGAPLSPSEFDDWCDRAIDGGSIVPQYHRSASQPDLWVRCVRAGERRNEKLKYWVHGALSRAAQHHEKLSWYVAEKTIATLVACLGPDLRHELRKEICSARDEFGARAQLAELKHQPFLLDWAVQVGLIERVARSKTDQRQLITVASQFDTLFPASSNTVSRGFRVMTDAIVDAFMTVASVLKGDDRDLAILAISTCASEEEYLASLSTELEVWLSHPRFNIAGLATDLSAATELSRRERGDLKRRLAASATALAQSEKKRLAFQRRIELRDRLDTKFTDPGLLGYSTGWEEYLRVRIDEGERQHRANERYLFFASLLGRRAMSVVRALLSELWFDATTEEHTVARHVADFNKLLEQGRSRGLHIIEPPELTIEEFPLDAPGTALKRGARLLLDVEVTVHDIWSTHRRPATAGALARMGSDVAVLMWDLMGSSSADPVDTGEIIHRVNEKIAGILRRKRGQGFHADQDDGNAAILPTVADAVEMFHALRMVFENEGCFVRAAIESTIDADKLQRNTITGEFNGRPYQIAARALAAFKEAASAHPPPTFTDGHGQKTELSPPTGSSYLNLTRRALEALRYGETSHQPEDTALYGVIKGFRPRVQSTLPTDVYCFVPVS